MHDRLKKRRDQSGFEPFTVNGVGLHTGARVTARVETARPGSGIVFEVYDRPIPARVSSIAPFSRLATVLQRKGRKVSTVEHLLASLFAFGVSEARIVLQGPEVPILDGSALPWCSLLTQAGARPGFRFFKIKRRTTITLGDSVAMLRPLEKAEEPSISVTIEYQGKGLLRQSLTFRPLVDDFVSSVAPARTFAFESDLSEIVTLGLAKGGNLDNALVIGENGPINPEGLRFPDELVRHKLLDALGDLSLLGGFPWAKIDLFKPGHGLLHKVTRMVCETRSPARLNYLRGSM